MALVRCPSPSDRPRSATEAPLPSPAPYFVRSTCRGTDRPRAESSLQRRTRRCDSSSSSVSTSHACRASSRTAPRDYALGPPTYFVDNAARLARRHGVNKSQFFVVPVPGACACSPEREHVHSSRPRSTGGSSTRLPGFLFDEFRRSATHSGWARRSSRWDRSAIARTDRSTSSSRGRRLRFRTAYRVPSRWSRRGSAVSS